MTAIELRASINNDLQFLSEEFLYTVAQYVKGLVAHPRPSAVAAKAVTAENGMSVDEKIQIMRNLTGIAKITEDDLNEDERLAYILRNNR